MVAPIKSSPGTFRGFESGHVDSTTRYAMRIVIDLPPWLTREASCLTSFISAFEHKLQFFFFGLFLLFLLPLQRQPLLAAPVQLFGIQIVV